MDSKGAAIPTWNQMVEEDRTERDKEGYTPLTLKQHASRLLSVMVFIVVFPFVFAFLGVYKIFVMVGAIST